MFDIEERKIKRAKDVSIGINTLTDGVYNAWLGGTILYGILMNILICMKFTDFALSISPTALILGYFVSAFTGIFLATRSKSPYVGFLGYNLVVCPVGLVLSLIVHEYGGLSSDVVQQAFALTLGITAGMVFISIMRPGFFSSLGKILFFVLLALLITDLILLFLGIDPIIVSVLGAGLFSLYIGYDFWKSQQYPKTISNAIESALDIYLDIINLFIRLLKIINKFKK